LSTEAVRKSGWDKVEIIGKGVLLPVILAIFGVLANMQLSAINERLQIAERDADLMMNFYEIYYGKDSRRLSITFVRVITNPKTKSQLRHFIIWDALERNLKEGFKFDPELGDWHLLGEALHDMAEDDRDWTTKYRQNLVDTTDKRWPQHKIELTKMHDWVKKTYGVP
jgi:hypothetical protein